MSDLLFNIRFGCYHFQVRRHRPWVQIHKNMYWANGVWKQDPFCVYVIFGKQL